MRQEGIANSWLSRQKPVLSCCPQCKKPLPRCAVCLLSMGCLNPYMELQRERGAYSRGGGAGKQLQQQQQGAEDLSGLASVPFSDWWSWCLKCKHGGHAHHLNSWFEKHSTCPVSGCDCRCQADIGNASHRSSPTPYDCEPRAPLVSQDLLSNPHGSHRAECDTSQRINNTSWADLRVDIGIAGLLAERQSMV
ncbi:hypothetical protein THAOC_17929 [Thalassiosira oceanica]|uniref:GATOR2 complex protein MIO zinc-ribbon like domain-containing protein n=1 Tax=Thalassiosira oceanica TaxID=159749 RepID=K0STE1_THAOC|nr:hypothetical protein THAOC_17929 [Thalassiosira oceanica]|eukprot:EJK61562.1 hypothetical protein THAOC_17929 [Thalassiosira oceanica]